MSQIVVLGAGLVACPAVKYIKENSTSAITVVAAIQAELDRLAAQIGPSTIDYVLMDVSEENTTLHKLLDSTTVVLCLLPTPFIDMVAHLCLAHSCHLVTASYTTAAIAAMHSACVTAGLVMLSECGLDPGIDHMLARDTIDKCHKVIAFESHCGGIPAERGGNVLDYKFSWSPLGVLKAIKAPAKFLVDGNEVVETNVLSGVHTRDMADGLVSMPNRDATKYTKLYSIDNVPSIYRGTLRYANGFIPVVNKLKTLGLLDDDTPVPESTWPSLMARLLKVDENDLLPAAQTYFGEYYDGVVKLDLFTGALHTQSSCMESLAAKLQSVPIMQYSASERDLTVIINKVTEETVDGRIVTHTVTMRVHGDEEHTAMARTVGLTAGIATVLVANGALPPGVHLPTSRLVYQPALRRKALNSSKAQNDKVFDQTM